MSATGILLCAGGSTRMGFDKLMTPVSGKCAIARSAEALIAGGVTEIVFAVSERTRAFCEALPLSVPKTLVQGGAERRDSVRNAIAAATGDILVIHDAARCLVSPAIVRSSIASAEQYGNGVVALSVTDTVFLSEDGKLTRLPREKLLRMQTPQTFRKAEIAEAYRNTAPEAAEATDDCTLYALAGYVPHFVAGSEDNFKLTTPADFARAERYFTRYGTGFDTHRLVEGRKLILGGVDIPYEKGLLGHSDADVLTHAVMDALLGAAGLPDIGHLFPDTDPAFKDADSMVLLGKVVAAVAEKGLRPATVSAEIIAQRPKLAPHLPGMKRRFAEVLGIPEEDIALAATTTEGMNDEGRGLCISAQAVASAR
ncbi:MAG: 2-C-methyl-D-erythritol 2,4-cyclodiphosphate synthase [Clostridia bacterium]|nr:2-C-methyl-D-erythritol 2,4-cyclodiphosphate synthase [Clostridia bacterium]